MGDGAESKPGEVAAEARSGLGVDPDWRSQESAVQEAGCQSQLKAGGCDDRNRSQAEELQPVENKSCKQA